MAPNPGLPMKTGRRGNEKSFCYSSEEIVPLKRRGFEDLEIIHRHSSAFRGINAKEQEKIEAWNFAPEIGVVL